MTLIIRNNSSSTQPILHSPSSIAFDQRVPAIVSNKLQEPQMLDNCTANKTVNLSDFWSRLAIFVPDVEIDGLPFDGRSIQTDLKPIAEQLKELATLYSDLQSYDHLNALQQIDHFYTFLMNKFTPETESSAATFNLPSILPDVDLEKSNRVQNAAPNTVSQELAEIVKNPKNWVKFFLLLGTLIFLGLSPIPYLIIAVLFLTFAALTNHFLHVDAENKKWHAVQKIHEIAGKLLYPPQESDLSPISFSSDDSISIAGESEDLHERALPASDSDLSRTPSLSSSSENSQGSFRPISPTESTDSDISNSSNSTTSDSSNRAQTFAEILPEHEIAKENDPDPKPQSNLIQRVAGQIWDKIPNQVKEAAPKTWTWIRSKIPPLAFRRSILAFNK